MIFIYLQSFINNSLEIQMIVQCNKVNLYLHKNLVYLFSTGNLILSLTIHSI